MSSHTPSHTIRRAALNDLPTLRHFWTLHVLSETYPEDQIEDVDTATRQLAAMLAAPEPAPGYAFLAELASDPVGMILYQICRRAVGSPHRYGFCSHLYVLPEHRRRGIALDLIEVAATHGMSQGITSVELNAAPQVGALHQALGHTAVALRMQTTPTRLIAAVDRMRGRERPPEPPPVVHADYPDGANGHDVVPVPAPLEREP